MTNTITIDQLRDLVDGRSAVLLEVLPPEHFEREHLPGARNLPLDAVDSLAASLVADQTQAIVTYCSNEACTNSGIAATRLAELGYTDVRKFPGGKEEWANAGLPLERGA